MKRLRDLCSEDLEKECYVTSLIHVELTYSYMII